MWTKENNNARNCQWYNTFVLEILLFLVVVICKIQDHFFQKGPSRVYQFQLHLLFNHRIDALPLILIKAIFLLKNLWWVPVAMEKNGLRHPMRRTSVRSQECSWKKFNATRQNICMKRGEANDQDLNEKSP